MKTEDLKRLAELKEVKVTLHLDQLHLIEGLVNSRLREIEDFHVVAAYMSLRRVVRAAIDEVVGKIERSEV